MSSLIITNNCHAVVRYKCNISNALNNKGLVYRRNVAEKKNLYLLKNSALEIVIFKSSQGVVNNKTNKTLSNVVYIPAVSATEQTFFKKYLK